MEIAKQDTPERMASLYEQVKEADLKSRQLREITRRPKDPGGHNVLKEITVLMEHLKGIGQDQVSVLADPLKRLKSLIEEIIPA